jgi:BON domain
MRRTVVLALAATAGLALACNREAPDPKLDQTVMARLAKEPALVSSDLHVRSDGNHVFLTGRVKTPDQRKIAGEVADDVYGVDRVTNDIQVDVAAPPPTPMQKTTPEAMPPEEVPPTTMPGEPAPDEAPENSR